MTQKSAPMLSGGYYKAIIARLSDKDLSYNSVEMTQKSCFLMVAEPGFGVGSVQ